MSGFVIRAATLTVLACSTWFTSDAQAYCREYIEDKSQQLNYTYICENSLKSPPYLIVRQYIGELEFEMFELGYRDVRLLCSRAVLDNGKKFGECSRYGLRGFKQRYANGAYNIEIGSLNQNEVAKLYEQGAVYRFPAFAQQVPDIGCAIVLDKSKTVHWRFPTKQPERMSECLLNFELFATNERLRF